MARAAEAVASRAEAAVPAQVALVPAMAVQMVQVQGRVLQIAVAVAVERAVPDRVALAATAWLSSAIPVPRVLQAGQSQPIAATLSTPSMLVAHLSRSRL